VPAGAPFTYHGAVSVDSFTPSSTADSSGDLVRVDLAAPHGLAGVDAASVSASARCRFGATETAATYHAADALRPYPRLVCRALPAALPFGQVRSPPHRAAALFWSEPVE
jgi:hypothetical protein